VQPFELACIHSSGLTGLVNNKYVYGAKLHETLHVVIEDSSKRLVQQQLRKSIGFALIHYISLTDDF